MLWRSLFVAVGFGFIFGGWRSLRLAREGELQQAHRTLHLAALLAGVCGGLLPFPILGWPWSAVTESVFEEVEEKLIEPFDVPVSGWKLNWVWKIPYPWREHWMEHHEKQKTVTVTVPHDETRRQIRWFLPLLMFGIGILCYYAEKWFVSLTWRFVG